MIDLRRDGAARELAWLMLAAFVVIAAGIGLRDPWPADEPRFTYLAKSMIESGEWLIPRRSGALYSDKPPMFLWLQAGAMQLMGGSVRLGFLLPSLLAAMGTLWLVYDLGRRLWTRRVGLYAAWILLFTLQFTYQAKRAQIDMVLLFLVTLANHGLLLALLRGPDDRRWGVGWFAAGIGTITKAVGVLALLMLPVAAWAKARGWPGLRLPPARRWFVGAALFVAALLVWLGPMLWTVWRSGDPELHGYVHGILFRQTVTRYTDSWDHQLPFWYQFSVVLSFWLPAALALPWAIPAWWRRLRRRDPRYLLPLAWFAMVLVFFSIPEGKRDVYIMPALPMFCLALAPLAPGLLRRVGPRALLLAFVVALGGVLLLAGLAMLLGEPGFERRLLEGRSFLPGEVDWMAGLLVVMGGWMLGCTAWFRARRAGRAAAWALGGLWVAYALGGYPVLDRHSTPRELMQRVDALAGPGIEVGAVAWREAMLLASDRRIHTFGFGPDGDEDASWAQQWAGAAAWQAQAPDRRWLLVLDEALPACVKRDALVDAGKASRRRWWLVPAAAVPAGCGAGPGDSSPPSG